jgi:hypothetical protein
MLTRRQAIIIALWVGAPFILMLALMLINPAYESKLFVNIGRFYGVEFLIFLQAVNGFILFLGFRLLNHAARSSDGRLSGRVRIAYWLLRVIVLVLTLAAFWVVILYPSVIFLLQGAR